MPQPSPITLVPEQPQMAAAWAADALRVTWSEELDVSVVVPVRNEAPNIESLIGEIEAALTGMRFEIIYVDDGSDDGTDAVLAGLAAQSGSRLRVFRHAPSAGQSAAVRTGALAARAALIATLDGDGQNDPADLPALIAVMRASGRPSNLALVGGNRKASRRDTWWKRRTSVIANTVRGWMLHDDTPDSGCGLKVFRRDAYLLLPYFDHLHRFMPAVFLREGWTVRSLPVGHRPRTRGTSKYGTWDRLTVGIVDLFGVAWLRRRRRTAGTIQEQ